MNREKLFKVAEKIRDYGTSDMIRLAQQLEAMAESATSDEVEYVLEVF